jgi:hypothetical protein
MPESETSVALRRATRRAVFHLLRAGVESLKAVEAFVDELARVGHQEGESPDGGEPRRVRIDVE